MSKPFKKKNSPNYYVRVKMWHAATQAWKWRNVCTKSEDYEVADNFRQALQEKANAARKIEGKTVDKKHLEAILTSIYESAGVVVNTGVDWPRISDYMQDFMAARRQRVTDVSFKTYQSYHRFFLLWLPKDVTLDWLTPVYANKFYTHALNKLSVRSANTRLGFVSGIYTRAMKELGYPSNPCQAVDVASYGSSDKLNRIPFTYDELMQLVDFLNKNTDERKREWGRAVMISAMTGARLEDAITMTSDNIKGDVLRYTPRKTQRFGNSLEIPLVFPDWTKIIHACRGSICPNLSNIFYASGSQGLSRTFTRLVSEAGIEQKYKVFKSGRKGARKTFHSLRHTLRTLIVSSGGSDAQADLILGHSGSQGKTYTHSELDATRAMLGRVFGVK